MSNETPPVDTDTGHHRITLRLRTEVYEYLRDRAYQNKVAKRPGATVTALVNNLLEGVLHEHQLQVEAAAKRASDAGLVTRG